MTTESASNNASVTTQSVKESTNQDIIATTDKYETQGGSIKDTAKEGIISSSVTSRPHADDANDEKHYSSGGNSYYESQDYEYKYEYESQEGSLEDTTLKDTNINTYAQQAGSSEENVFEKTTLKKTVGTNKPYAGSSKQSTIEETSESTTFSEPLYGMSTESASNNASVTTEFLDISIKETTNQDIIATTDKYETQGGSLKDAAKKGIIFSSVTNKPHADDANDETHYSSGGNSYYESQDYEYKYEYESQEGSIEDTILKDTNDIDTYADHAGSSEENAFKVTSLKNTVVTNKPYVGSSKQSTTEETSESTTIYYEPLYGLYTESVSNNASLTTQFLDQSIKESTNRNIISTTDNYETKGGSIKDAAKEGIILSSVTYKPHADDTKDDTHYSSGGNSYYESQDYEYKYEYESQEGSIEDTILKDTNDIDTYADHAGSSEENAFKVTSLKNTVVTNKPYVGSSKQSTTEETSESTTIYYEPLYGLYTERTSNNASVTTQFLHQSIKESTTQNIISISVTNKPHADDANDETHYSSGGNRYDESQDYEYKNEYDSQEGSLEETTLKETDIDTYEHQAGSSEENAFEETTLKKTVGTNKPYVGSSKQSALKETSETPTINEPLYGLSTEIAFNNVGVTTEILDQTIKVSTTQNIIPMNGEYEYEGSLKDAATEDIIPSSFTNEHEDDAAEEIHYNSGVQSHYEYKDKYEFQDFIATTGEYESQEGSLNNAVTEDIFLTSVTNEPQEESTTNHNGLTKEMSWPASTDDLQYELSTDDTPITLKLQGQPSEESIKGTEKTNNSKDITTPAGTFSKPQEKSYESNEFTSIYKPIYKGGEYEPQVDTTTEEIYYYSGANSAKDHSYEYEQHESKSESLEETTIKKTISTEEETIGFTNNYEPQYGAFKDGEYEPKDYSTTIAATTEEIYYYTEYETQKHEYEYKEGLLQVTTIKETTDTIVTYKPQPRSSKESLVEEHSLNTTGYVPHYSDSHVATAYDDDQYGSSKDSNMDKTIVAEAQQVKTNTNGIFTAQDFQTLKTGQDTDDTEIEDAGGEYDTSIVFENFFDENTDFLEFSKKFQVDGWKGVLKNPYQNQDKFQQIIKKYIQKMLEVQYCNFKHLIHF